MKLTVAQLLPALDWGGVEQGTLEITRALTARGHRALVISAGGRLVEHITAAGGEHICLPVGKKSLSSLLLISKLRALFARERVDITHARSRVPAWLTHFALRGLPAAARPKFLTTVHGPYSVNRYSAIMTRGTPTIAISDYIRDYILRNYPLAGQQNMVVIPRGVDRAVYACGYQPPADWRAAFAREFPQTAGKTLLAIIGRLSRRKGQTDFIDLIAQLRQRGQTVHGLIVGGAEKPEYEAELRARVAQQQLREHITPTGARGDAREIMSLCNIVFMLATEPEAFGRTTLEALSLGVPVIGYAHSGTAEILRTIYPDGQTPPGDARALLQKTEMFLQQAPAVPREHPYTLQAMCDAELALYERVVTA